MLAQNRIGMLVHPLLILEKHLFQEITYPAMIGITDDQGAMCFLGLVIAIKTSSVLSTGDRCISKPIFNPKLFEHFPVKLKNCIRKEICQLLYF